MHDCTCQKFEGCENCIGYENYYFLCSVWNTYSAYEFDESSYKILTLFSKAGSLFVDFKKCYGFDIRPFFGVMIMNINGDIFLQVHVVVCIYKIVILIVIKSS